MLSRRLVSRPPIIYRVGVFRTYNDVLARLNAVKKAGFKTAYIVPFYDGKVIKMAEAKALEKEKQTSVTYRIEMSPEGGILPDVALKEGSWAVRGKGYSQV